MLHILHFLPWWSLHWLVLEDNAVGPTLVDYCQRSSLWDPRIHLNACSWCKEILWRSMELLWLAWIYHSHCYRPNASFQCWDTCLDEDGFCSSIFHVLEVLLLDESLWLYCCLLENVKRDHHRHHSIHHFPLDLYWKFCNPNALTWLSPHIIWSNRCTN